MIEAQLKTHRDDQPKYIHNRIDDQTDERLGKKESTNRSILTLRLMSKLLRGYINKEYLSSLKKHKTAEIQTSRLLNRAKLYIKSLNSKLALKSTKSQTAIRGNVE